MKDTYGSMLTYLRKRAGLTQAQLADALNVSPATIGLYEQDRRRPNFEMEEAIADFFNVDLNYLRGSHYVTVPVENDGNIKEFVLLKKEMDLIQKLRENKPTTIDDLIKYMEMIKDLYNDK